MSLLQLLILTLAASGLCAGLIRAALPHAGRLALAVPNGRSSHVAPTPQSGGLFVLATLLAIDLAGAVAGAEWAPAVAHILAPACILAAIGWTDDRFGLPVTARLVAYAMITGGFVAFAERAPVPDMTGDIRIDGLLAVAFLLALVNVANFMDGIDGMIVAEFTPMLLLFSLFATVGWLSPVSGGLAAALAGALLGFFVFNRPKARIFLGDSGSLTVGFLCGTLLLEFARVFGVLAALILPLYFLLDAGLTLGRRIWRGEKFWSAHRQHFYQRAFDSGQSNWSILRRVAAFNVISCGGALGVASGQVGLCPASLLAIGAASLLLLSLRTGATRT